VRRVWRLGWKTRETKDGDRESLETKDGDRESLETQGGERESFPASRESAGRQQWAEHRLKAVREGQVGQPAGTDFGLGVERFSGPCAIGKQRFPEALYKAAKRWQLNQSITRIQTFKIT